MKTKAKILIEVEVDDFDPYKTEIKDMVIEGDAVTLSIALLSAGWGMFNEDAPIEPQLKEKIEFQKAVATCILNGTITLNGQIPEEAVETLSVMLKKLTDTNIMLLEAAVQNQFLTKKDKTDEQGRTKRTDFSNFS